MRKPQGEGSAATSGLLIGLMFGFLVALGMFKQTLKSQRSDVFPYAVTIGVILAAVVGYKIGNRKDQEIYRDEFLGINKIETRHVTEGAYWFIESSWMSSDDQENKLITTMMDGEMVSIYNTVVITNHGHASNSRTATKAHEEVKMDLIQKLKDGFPK